MGYGALLKSLALLWREEPELRRATIIQGCLFGSFSALWTILALQLDARYRHRPWRRPHARVLGGI